MRARECDILLNEVSKADHGESGARTDGWGVDAGGPGALGEPRKRRDRVLSNLSARDPERGP